MNNSDKDFELFRESVGSVRRVRSDRVQSRPPAPRAQPRQRQQDERAVMDDLASAPIDFSAVETGEEISYLRPGLQKRVLTRLRRGHWRVQDQIDLHQMNLEAAGRTIREFLAHAEREGFSCVKIIHGKGLRSGPDGPQIKRLAARLLSRHSRVAAFASAPPHDGGTGAVHVLLSTRR
ncbi:Smr/MutS family protein [Wenzhouxiangella sp. AB-CW3]|uniref:Smr/MutS family protein n=1 Tax=Wenzhouxiangella sp. AB-CW3 TaxID=2771012 RepID=UPI00168A5418|nr:Smr/MutS family protein [Wenzhouxiangella sp. AB-CW3]QOC23674.1 Smr/MutS family protein [Wenzhouxiangella sp. AB-CW3]